MNTKSNEKLLYKDLSYQIQGAAIEVRKNFGSGLKETIYQNAFAEELKARNIKFDKEKSIQIFSPKTGKLIGSYRPDFIVENKILIELKAVEKIPKMFLDQIFSYLRNSKYELGYFINFASPKLYIKRVIFTNDRKPFIAKLLVSISLIFVLFGVLPLAVQAAVFEVVSQTPEPALFQQFQVDIMLDPEGQSINALEAAVLFPEDLVSLQEIREGESLVTFWVDKPQEQTTQEGLRSVHFSGVIPGGFAGVLSPFYKGARQGKVLSLIFIAKEIGEGVIEVKEQRTYLNDGLGTLAASFVSPLSFRVGKEIVLAPLPIPKDEDAPEPFIPEIASDPALFEGKYFLVFSAKDKGSGIDHYEVQESRKQKIENRKWQGVESPYVLKDQSLKSTVYVKAVDKAGNERIATVQPTHPLAWYETPLIWSILTVIGVIAALLFAALLWRKKK